MLGLPDSAKPEHQANGKAGMAFAVVEEFGVQQIELSTTCPIGAEVVISSAAQNPGESVIVVADASGAETGVTAAKKEGGRMH